MTIERRQVEHIQTAEGWVITPEDIHALSDRHQEWLMEIMFSVQAARGEVPPDPGMEDAEFVDVTPADGETLAALEALEVAG